MENKILEKLKFNLNIITPMNYIDRYCKAAYLNNQEFIYCRYILELSLYNI